MKRNKIAYFQELLVTQVNSLILYPLTMTLVTLFGGLFAPVRPSLTVWLLCGMLPLLFYWARLRLNRILPFLAVHLAVPGGLFALMLVHDKLPGGLIQSWNNPINCAASLLTVTGFAVYSLKLRLYEQVLASSMLPMPLAVGLAAVALYLQHYMKFQEWDSYYKLALILVLGLYFLQYYVKEYLNFLVVNASSTGVLPEKEIFHSGLLFALAYTLLGMLILVGTSQFAWLKAILKVIRQALYTLLRFLSDLFPRGESSTPELIVTEYSGGGGYELPEPGEPALIWQILEAVAFIAVLLGVLFLLFKALVKLWAYVKNVMRRGIKTRTEDFSGVQDVREKCEAPKRQKRAAQERHFFGFLTPGERIRRIYKKKAASYKPLPIGDEVAGKEPGKQASRSSYRPERVGFYTARELEQEMEHNTARGMEQMADHDTVQKNPAASFAVIYEKARYSEETCTIQDVKRMKELCR